MSDLNSLRESFTRQLPNLRRMASSKFICMTPDTRQEAIANALALTWMFIYRLFKKGRSDEPGILRSCLWYAVKQTKEGRTPQGCPRAKDLFHVRRFGKARFEEFDAEQFVGRFTPVFDQVSFRLDVPAFLDTLNSRQRNMALDLAGGMSTTEAATKYNLSPGRISQFRRLFKSLFDEFMAG
jgi:hypothetical protein